MRDHRVKVSLLSLCFLASTCCALSARAIPQMGDDNARIVGTVVDAGSHDPVASARVDLMGPGGMAAPTKYTNEDGKFYIGARDGDYQLVIRKMGYQNAQVDVSIVAAAQSRVDVALVRDPSDSASSPSSSETISARQLKIPEKARNAYHEGQALAAKHDYDSAVDQFHKAIKAFPPYYEAYADMGVAQYKLGQAEDARESLQKSVDLSEGKFPDALFDSADVLNALHDFADAESFARREITLEDSSWRGHYELARALLGLKRLPEAEQSARESQKLNAQNPPLYIVLVSIHAATRHYASVVQDIDAYLVLDPKGPLSDQMRATRAQATKALADAEAHAPKTQ